MSDTAASLLMSEDLKASLQGGFEFVLMTKVTNAKEVCAMLRQGSMEAGVVAPALIVSELHLRAAGQVAANNQARNKLITTTVNSEFIFTLSPSRTISLAFGTFGPAADATELLFGRYYEEQSPQNVESLAEYASSVVSGTITPLADISKYTDKAKLTEVYRITPEEMAISTLEDVVISRIAVAPF
eukprot:Rhum_TRINITY_DN23349_c0_g1::Rhum_TRINITY_DN23349_c0_g1_i1::g.177759::m.177759/K15901/CGI121, TPRKB; EKC/KEOPS complex subunit CGI121/TPRKB